MSDFNPANPQEIQLKGNIKLGPSPGELTSYSLYIAQLVITRIRPTVAGLATYGNPSPRQLAQADEWSVTIQYKYHEGDPLGVWLEVWSAMDEEVPELYFSAEYFDGPRGVNNPGFEGYLLVADADAGAPVNALRAQQKTWSARDVIGPLFTES